VTRVCRVQSADCRVCRLAGDHGSCCSAMWWCHSWIVVLEPTIWHIIYKSIYSYSPQCSSEWHYSLSFFWKKKESLKKRKKDCLYIFSHVNGLRYTCGFVQYVAKDRQAIQPMRPVYHRPHGASFSFNLHRNTKCVSSSPSLQLQVLRLTNPSNWYLAVFFLKKKLARHAWPKQKDNTGSWRELWFPVGQSLNSLALWFRKKKKTEFSVAKHKLPTNVH